jgi:hypothetical protein
MLRLIAVSFLVAGCSLLQQSGLLLVGDGPLKTESRTVTDFDKVDFNGGVKFQVTVGQPTSVSVSAQQNILEITTTTVQNGTLSVDTTRPYTTSDGVTVTITTPSLSAITVNGGVSGAVQGITGTNFAVDANGGASLTLAGTCTTLTFKGNGGAHVDGANLAATNATVDINGGASATLNVSGAVTGTANGGASLTLQGNPTTVSVNTSGGASVHH